MLTIELAYDCSIIAAETCLLVLFVWKSLDRKLHPVCIALLLIALQCVRRILIIESGFLSVLLSYGFDFITISLCFAGKIKKKVFLLTLFYAYLFIFDIAAILLVSSAVNFVSVSAVDMDLLHLPSTIVSRLILLGIILLVGKTLKSENGVYEWIRFMPVPVLTVLAISWLQPLSYETSDKNITWMFTAICIFSLLANIFSFVYIKSKNDKMQLDYRLKITEEHKRLRKAHIQELQSAYRLIERANHNLKNHLTYIANAPDLESVHKYVQEIINRTTPKIFELTGNFDIDTILNAKRHEANGIEMKVCGTLPAHIDWLDPVDVSILLGNALDNAIDACAECGFKVFSVKFVYDRFFIISIENPTCNKPVKKKCGAGLQSTKGKNRGIGMESMESVAARYDGHMEYRVENNLFHLDIMLQQRRNKQTDHNGYLNK